MVDFSHPVLAAACRLAAGGLGVQAALRAYDEHLAGEGKSGFARTSKRSFGARCAIPKGLRVLLASYLRRRLHITHLVIFQALSAAKVEWGRLLAMALKSNLKGVTKAIVTSADDRGRR